MRRIVIIGFGPVAARLIEELEEPLAQSRVHVCVIGSEPEGAYNRILLANLVTGHSTPQDLDLACDETNFPEGVTFLTGTTLSDISLDGQYLHTTDDRLISFDDLIFATGARAVLPRVPGLDVLDTDPCHLDFIPLPGVHPLRDMSDARRLREVVETGQDVLVLGGGILGIELALNLVEHGVQVSLIHRGQDLMPRQLDPDASRMLAHVLRQAGIQVIPGGINGVRSEGGRFTGVVLDDGTVREAGALIPAIGAQPRTEWAKKVRLPTHRGILVDHQLRVHGTSNIYAIGDCAEVLCSNPVCPECMAIDYQDSAPSGLIGPGWQQAQALADILDGTHNRVPSQVSQLITMKSQAVSLTAAGSVHARAFEQPRVDVATWEDPRTGRYLKVVSRDRNILGFVALGAPEAGAELAMLFERSGAAPGDPSVLLAADTPSGADTAPELTPESIICRCAGVALAPIQQAVSAGATTVAEVSKCSRAGTGCGGCKDKLESVVSQAMAA